MELQNYLFYSLLSLTKEDCNLQELKILKFVFEKKTTLTEISKKLKIDYKNTHRYIYKLHKKNLVILDPPKNSQGKKVYVTLSEKTLIEIINALETIMLRKESLKKIPDLIREGKRKLRYTQIQQNK